MLCQDCRKREAQVHLTQIVNNEKTTLNLCKNCAAARGFHSPLENAPFPLAEILSNIASKVPTKAESQETESLVCEKCGTSFEEFARQGRFGCGDCYQTFRGRLEMIMRKIHGASLHRGKAPSSVAEQTEVDGVIPVKEEERLEAELRKAVDSEDFERAAEIRDKLKTIRDSQAVDQ